MLAGQIEPSLRKKIAIELQIGLPVFNVKLTEKPTRESRFSKTKAVTRFIEKEFQIGTIDAPKEYFRGTLAMKWGSYGSTKPVDGKLLKDTYTKTETVLFGGSTSKTIVGMGGSRRHLIGSEGQSYTDSFSTTGAISDLLVNEELPASNVTHYTDKENWEQRILYATFLAVKKQRGVEQRVEFLARKLLFGPMPPNQVYRDEASKYHWIPAGTNVLLATPIYISHADEGS
jgi:hypothetical protein